MNTTPREEVDRRPVADVIPEGADLDSLPAETLITREGVWRFFGFSETTWIKWERRGRAPKGRWGRNTRGRPPKLFTAAELRAFRDELARDFQPYPDPERPGVYRVPIRSEKYQMEALIDAADVPLVLDVCWNWSQRSGGRQGEVVLSKVGHPSTPLKRIILGLPPGEDRIVYANADPLDCRRENLVVKTNAQSLRGSRKQRRVKGRPCTSRYKGVSWVTGRHRWTAHIAKDAKAYYLGLFRDEIECARAYDAAARRLFGIHARLNFPENPAEAAHAHLRPETIAKINQAVAKAA